MLHDNLLLKFQISLAENQNLALTRHIDIILGADRGEDLNRLTLARDTCDKPEILRREEVDRIRVLPHKLILISLEFVSPRHDELTTYVFNVGRLKVIQLFGAVWAVINSKLIVSSQLNLLKFQIDRFVDALNKFRNTRIDVVKQTVVFVYLRGQFPN